MAKYNDEFKANAVKCLVVLKKEGCIEVGSVDCFNVRQLVKELGISSYTLYQWYGKFIVKEEKEGTKTETNNFVVETPSIKKEVERIGFGISFWSFVAKNMGIKGYRVNLNQLKLKIGMELIKETGLINNNLVREKLRLDE